MEKQTMGSFIAALRRAAGMTQRELAERLNVSDKAVSRWERDECAPDLMLIPVIADLFGITADELLRGRRKSPSDENNVQSEAQQERERTLSEKSVRALAKKKLEKLRALSLVSGGIGIAGLVVALICDSVFFASKLGFFLSLLFYVAAIIVEVIAIASFFSSMDTIATSSFYSSAEERDRALTDPYRMKGFGWSSVIFTVIGGLMGMVLPLAEAPPYHGGHIAPLGGAILLAALGAVLAFLLCRFVIRPLLEKKAILPTPAPLTRRDLALRKIVKKHALILAILLTVTGVGAVIFNSIGVTAYAKAKVFHDYDSFVEYMEEGQYREQGLSEQYIAEIKENMDEDPVYEVLLDENGRELCRYREYYHNAVVKITYSFDNSDDGLPVKAYTDRAMEWAYDIRQSVNIILILLAGAEAAVCGILCYRKSRKV
ncbi:MAG: helix-turn-helix transcriptional regulator [Clostridia bacterium]|nr:helix-turn-helix transcriptional regulator [Clostridia bacterium]